MAGVFGHMRRFARIISRSGCSPMRGAAVRVRSTGSGDLFDSRFLSFVSARRHVGFTDVSEPLFDASLGS